MIYAAAIFEQSFDAALVWEWHGRITHWNPAAEQLYGIPRADAIGRIRHELLQTVFPGGKESFLLQLQTKGRAEVELRHTTRDGRQILVESRLRLLRGEDGPCVIETHRDITEGPRTEASRRQSAERLRQLVSASPAVIYSLAFVSGELVPTWVSDNVSQLAGYTVGEVFAPKWWVERLHPEDRSRVLGEHASPFPNDRLLTEYRFQRKDGSYFWVHDEKTLLRDAAGHPLEVVGSWTDITGRKRVEEALRESKERLHYLVSANPAMIYALQLVNGEMLPTWVSDNVARLTGFTPKEAFARGWWEERLHPDDRQRVVAEHAAAGPNKRLLSEYRFQHKDGSYFWVRDEMVFQDNGAENPAEVVGSWSNITDRKQAEQELEFKNLILSTQLEASIDGILVVDENGRVLSHNRRFIEMWRIPPGVVERSDDRELIQAVLDQLTDPDAFLERVRHLYAHRRETSHDEINLKGGRTFDRYTAPMFGADDRYHGRVWYFRDMTTQRRMQGQLIESQKMEMVGKLAGGIAHEFNSIITAIIGQSELLRHDLPSGSPLVSNVQEIRKAADRAATLTRQLLAYGRRQLLQPTVLDLNELLAEMADMLPHLLGEQVDFRLAPAAGLWLVHADAGQLEQVILNMAINAREAMPHGGKLTLETANVTLTGESVGRHPELKPGNYVMLAITDSGVGMSAEVRRRAFEPFFTTREVGKGTGLGLATCYGIIKQSGGHINVYSEPGQGTTFRVYLPQVESPSMAVPKPAAPPDLPRGTEKILLVEDDPSLRGMAATLLQRLGYRVITAANGVEALALVGQRGNDSPDLLLTDVVMPQMDGKKLADQIQSMRPETRVLFTSGYSERAIAHQGLFASGVAFLQKPFTPSALAHKLREVLDQPGTPQ